MKNQTIVPYFMVLDATKFIDFTKEVFQSEVINVTHFEGTEGVIHAEMKIGESTVYFADTSPDGSRGPEVYGDLKNDGPIPIHMYIFVDNIADTYKTAVQAGATPVMDVMGDEENGYMARFVDPFSNLWWLQSK